MSYHYHQGQHQTLTPLSTRHHIIFPYDRETKKFVTSNYIPIQTDNRVHHIEIEQFLEQVNIPIKKWHENYSLFYDPPLAFCCLFILCLFLLPLLFFLVCWLSSKQANAIKDLGGAIGIARTFVQIHNPKWAQRGFMWSIPVHPPQWIELWADYGQPAPRARIVQGIPVVPQPRRKPEIHTICLPQQNYQNVEMPHQKGYSYSPMSSPLCSTTTSSLGSPTSLKQINLSVEKGTQVNSLVLPPSN